MICAIMCSTVRIHHRHPRPVGQKILCLRGSHLGSCPLKAIILPFQPFVNDVSANQLWMDPDDTDGFVDDYRPAKLEVSEADGASVAVTDVEEDGPDLPPGPERSTA